MEYPGVQCKKFIVEYFLHKNTEDNLLPYVRSQSLGQNGIFQQDNNSKHSYNTTKRWLIGRKSST
uniref:Ovule protein n=1 Tax=Heterorhabditis bacteriophora TaxID=37862 RepID=A0A1I7XF09_HETBA